MRHLLNKFDSISPKALEKLSQAGIENTDQLLALASLPAKRIDLAQKLQVNPEELTRWACLADLVRVKGIGPALAELLVESGVAKNVQSLIDSLQNPEQAYATIKSHVSENQDHSYIPDKQRLLAIAEEAAELRPKLLLNPPDVDPSFRKDVFSRVQEERSHLRRISFAITGIVILTVGILYVLTRVYFNNMISEVSIPADPLNQLVPLGHIAVDIVQIALNISYGSLLLIIGIVLLFWGVLSELHNWLTYFQDAWLVVWLFDHPRHRKFYRTIKSIKLSKQLRGAWVGVAIFTILAIYLVVSAFRHFQVNAPIDELEAQIETPVILGGVLLGAVISLPLLQFYFQTFRGKDNQDSVQRYLIYYLSKAISMPLLVVLLAQVILPLSFYLHEKIYQDYIVPSARQTLLDERAEIVNLEIKDPANEIRREELLQLLDNDILLNLDTFASIESADNHVLADVYIPAVLNMVVWVALIAYLMLFVIPYFILGGWRRGIFYIIVLGISFCAEDWLSAHAPEWFRLPENSFSSLLMIAFFVFANALFFDWVFDTLTQENKACPSCATKLPPESFYCSCCGFAQE